MLGTHCYMAVITHYEEIGVVADGHSGDPPPGPPPLRRRQGQTLLHCYRCYMFMPYLHRL
jgi:hypothetical protein